MKRFKDMFEDAPVNATGDAVATNEPIAVSYTHLTLPTKA